MNILAIDTATAVLSVAVSAGERGFRYFEAAAGNRHSELLPEIIDYVIKNAGLCPADLEVAACMRGPGSFTGLRIGFASVKGMALALGIPMVSAPTLDCMAFPLSFWPGIVIPLIDAKQHRYFTALYRGGERISDYLDAETGDIILRLERVRAAEAGAADPPVLLSGPDAPMLLPGLISRFGEGAVVLDPAHAGGKARELLAISAKYSILNKGDAPGSGPLYLRKSDAELVYENTDRKYRFKNDL
ncbi:MAG: tRNA (adenosine(37)-N6)-threonylcarbamoyltransferase complex dimerization subunit type 1 TsaB [Spirochaetaceae bacterium]|nr:tRNA (adenosine(37)-N6)-threonylcarbamoyltransferase complex dimerization subunit type 1 TsaB [Spirochaetaceae bacterium]